MNLAIMQPYILPYIGYFQLIAAVDLFVLYDDVSYIKKGWVNRNRLLVNGTACTFTVPLKNASQNVLIKDLVVGDNIADWIEQILKTIERSYSKAPNYTSVKGIIDACLSCRSPLFLDWIEGAFIHTASYLNLKINMVRSSTLDYNRALKGQDKILELCSVLGAKQYVNAIGGMALYNKEAFNLKGIELKFIKSNPFEYTQLDAQFVAWLSIIDVLMFNPIDVIRKYVDSGYSLV